MLNKKYSLLNVVRKRGEDEMLRHSKCSVCFNWSSQDDRCLLYLKPKICGLGENPNQGFAPVSYTNEEVNNWKIREMARQPNPDPNKSSKKIPPDIPGAFSLFPEIIQFIGDSSSDEFFVRVEPENLYEIDKEEIKDYYRDLIWTAISDAVTREYCRIREHCDIHQNVFMPRMDFYARQVMRCSCQEFEVERVMEDVIDYLYAYSKRDPTVYAAHLISNLTRDDIQKMIEDVLEGEEKPDFIV